MSMSQEAKNGEVFELRWQKNQTPRLGITLLFLILIASTSIKSFVFIILLTWWKESKCIPMNGSASSFSSWLKKTIVLHSCCFLPPREIVLASTTGHLSLQCLTYPQNEWHIWLGDLLRESEDASLSTCSFFLFLEWAHQHKAHGLCSIMPYLLQNTICPRVERSAQASRAMPEVCF